MIEIIIQHVKMPETALRRYQREFKCTGSGIKWWVVDTENENKIVFKGRYEDVCIACYNLNKKHYKP